MNKFSLILFLTGLSLSSLQSQNNFQASPEDRQLAFQEFNAVLDKLPPIVAPKLLEGLPHPMYEKALLNKELKRDDIVEIEHFAFYRKPCRLHRIKSQTSWRL